MLSPRSLRVLCISLAFFALTIATCGTAGAQSLIPSALLGKTDQNTAEKHADPQQLGQSLDVVIQTLENDDSRQALLKQLKSLRDGATTQSAKTQQGQRNHHGLLGALADSLNRLTRPDGPARISIDLWTRNTQQAASAAWSLLTQASPVGLFGATAGLIVWLVALYLLAKLGRALFARQGWPLTLPSQPQPWMLLAHFLRRVLPWLLTFIALLAGLHVMDIPIGARSLVLVIAYITLCARVLTSLFDIVIALFSSGHRQTAVNILHRRALVPLFIIGALAALGDAASSQRLTTLLSPELARWLSATASVIAALLSGYLVLRNRRPITHLIRNRPYPHRRAQGWLNQIVSLLGRLWPIPTLLAIGSSLTVTLVTGSAANATFGKALVCAALLVITLATVGLLGIKKHTASRRRRSRRYARRLVRFAYTTTQAFVWFVYLELTLYIWGFSLLGLGQTPALSSRIGHGLLGLGVTAMLAWLVWIFADAALERVLRDSSNRRGTTARAQTITPIVRNTVFFTILVIASIVALANLGVNVTPLLAGAGIIGLAVGFGAQTLVQDLITGLFIVVEDSMAVGDFVEINGFMGTVEGFNLRTVRLRDLEGVVHHITFSKISSIHNMSRQFGITLLKIRIPRELPIDDAITLMKDTAAELRRQPAMLGLIWSPLEIQDIHSFEEGCPVLRMRMRTRPEYQWNVGRAFNLLLKRRMEAQNLDLAAPRLSVHMQAEGGTHYSLGGKTGSSETSETLD